MAFGEGLSGRTVLVTGHTGFKGSWLTIWLQHLGATVHGFALDPPTDPSNFEASRVGDLLRSDTRGDVTDLSTVRHVLDSTRPDVVFHLAAQPLMRRAWEDPAGTFATNVMGTVTVLEAVRLSRRPCVVVCITSDKCYDNQEWNWGYRENDRLGGREAYGASKAAAELVVHSYRSTYFPEDSIAEHGVRVATTRAGNVIGGGDWSPDRVVPDVVRALSTGRRIEIRSPGAVRPWQHVLVPLSGYITLAERMLDEPCDPALCSGWNFGPDRTAMVDVRRLVEEAITHWGGGSWGSVDDSLVRHESTLLHLNTDKALNLLGWYPQWDFTESVRRTMAWYRRACRQGAANMRSACLCDIEAYEAALGDLPAHAGAHLPPPAARSWVPDAAPEAPRNAVDPVPVREPAVPVPQPALPLPQPAVPARR